MKKKIYIYIYYIYYYIIIIIILLLLFIIIPCEALSNETNLNKIGQYLFQNGSWFYFSNCLSIDTFTLEHVINRVYVTSICYQSNVRVDMTNQFVIS
jgi:hypothetical protein